MKNIKRSRAQEYSMKRSVKYLFAVLAVLVAALFIVISSQGPHLFLQPTLTTVFLSWTDNSNNEDGFIVQRSTDSNFPISNTVEVCSTLSNVNSCSEPLSGLLPDTTYYYRVFAQNTIGNSGFSNIFPLPKYIKRPAIGIDISDRSIKFTELINRHGHEF